MVELGDSVSIQFNLSKVHFFDQESENRILLNSANFCTESLRQVQKSPTLKVEG